MCFSAQFGTDARFVSMFSLGTMLCVFFVQFGTDAVCVSVFSLGWMLSVFQCTIWDRC